MYKCMMLAENELLLFERPAAAIALYNILRIGLFLSVVWLTDSAGQEHY